MATKNCRSFFTRHSLHCSEMVLYFCVCAGALKIKPVDINLFKVLFVCGTFNFLALSMTQRSEKREQKTLTIGEKKCTRKDKHQSSRFGNGFFFYQTNIWPVNAKGIKENRDLFWSQNTAFFSITFIYFRLQLESAAILHVNVCILCTEHKKPRNALKKPIFRVARNFMFRYSTFKASIKNDALSEFFLSVVTGKKPRHISHFN